MFYEKILKFAGSIGGGVGHSGGSIGGGVGNSGGSIGGSSGGSSPSSDCIIVHSLEQVQYLETIAVLRDWRDSVLSTSEFGKMFIRFYYSISPKLVVLSGNMPVIKKPVKATAIYVANRLKGDR